MVSLEVARAQVLHHAETSNPLKQLKKDRGPFPHLMFLRIAVVTDRSTARHHLGYFPETTQPTSTPRVLGTNDLELLVFVEVQEKDLALGVEVVGGSGQFPSHRVLHVYRRHQLPPSVTPLAREGPPRRPVVSAAFAVRTLPKTRVTDGYSPSHRLSAFRFLFLLTTDN